MRIVQIYHSSTGNTRLCAEVFERRAVDAGHQCRTIDVRDVGDGREVAGVIRDCDLFGLAVPTYYFKAPANVTEFVEALPVFEPKPAFVLNCRTDTTANTISLLARQLQRKNLFLIDSLRVRGEESYPPFRFKWYIPGKGAPTGDDLHKVRDFADTVCARAAKISADANHVFAKRHYVVWPTPFQFIAAAASRRNMARYMLGRRLVPDACTSCGICARECPVGTVAMFPHALDDIERRRDVTVRRRSALHARLAASDTGTVELPVFSDACMGCYACVNLCPTQALYTFVANGRPPYRGPAAKISQKNREVPK